MAEKKNTKRLVYIALLLLIPVAYYVAYGIGKQAADRHNRMEITEYLLRSHIKNNDKRRSIKKL